MSVQPQMMAHMGAMGMPQQQMMIAQQQQMMMPQAVMPQSSPILVPYGGGMPPGMYLPYVGSQPPPTYAVPSPPSSYLPYAGSQPPATYAGPSPRLAPQSNALVRLALSLELHAPGGSST